MATENKPTVRFVSAGLMKIGDGFRLIGCPLDYPEHHQYFPGAVSNHKEILSSPIVSINPDLTLVETERTLYKIESWRVSKEEARKAASHLIW